MSEKRVTAKHVTVEARQSLIETVNQCRCQGYECPCWHDAEQAVDAWLAALPDDCPADLSPRRDHDKVESMQPGSFLCDQCEDVWPCEVVREAGRAEAAEADAAALAEALRERHNGWPMCGFDDGTGRRIYHGYADDCEVRVMLRAHDRRVQGDE